MAETNDINKTKLMYGIVSAQLSVFNTKNVDLRH